MRRNISRCLILLVITYPGLFSFFGEMATTYAIEPKIIKFATVAPDQSTWTNVIRDIDKELREKSKGRLGLKIYAGGVMGDEKDGIKQMQDGQLDCAGVTGVGLGEFITCVRLYDLPFFLKDYEEVDFIRNQFRGRCARLCEKKGYVLLGWTEVGFVYFFSNRRIDSLDELRSTKTKIWMWEGDAVAKALFDALKISPIPLSINDVKTSLQSGLINTVYASPLGAIVLQWFTNMKYILELPIANASSTILITKKYYDTLPGDLQETLIDVFKKNMVRLTNLTRKDNAAAIDVMKAYGIELISVKDELVIKKFEDAGVNTRKALAGELYPAELLKEVTAELEKYRKERMKAETKGGGPPKHRNQ